MTEISTKDILLKAAEIMSEAEGCCTNTFGRSADGEALDAGTEASQYCRQGAIARAARVLGATSLYAIDVLEAFCKREYGWGTADVNDELFPDDKEQAVLDLKRVAAQL